MPRLAKRAVPVVLWLLSLAASAQPLPPPWVALGPFGGQVQTLTADPIHSGTLYATTPQGIFKTVDGAATWAAINLGRPGSNVAIDPVNPSILYVGLYGSLLAKSTDGGAHWSPANAGLTPNTSFSPTQVRVDPSNPSRLLLAYLGRLWRSTDAGGSWQPVTAGLGNGSTGSLGNIVFDLAFASRPAGTAFAATLTGLYRSTDAGASWRLTRGLSGIGVRQVAVAPSDPRTVYAFLTTLGLYRSVDGGDSWQRATSRTDIFAHFFVSPRDPRTLYASGFDGSLFRSTDGGAHWSTLRHAPAVESVAFDAGAPQRLYAGSQLQLLGGVWRSDDGGTTWTRRNDRMTGLPATFLAVDPEAPERLWLESTGLFHSANRGMRWAGITAPTLRQLAVGDSGVLFAGVLHSFGLPGAPQLYALSRTVDGGAAWTTLLDVNDFDVHQIRTAPSRPSTVYAAGVTPEITDPRITPRLYRSTDDGITWELRSSGAPLPFCEITDLEVSPSAAATVYLAGSEPNLVSNSCERVVIRSDDGGATWASASAGLPELGVAVLAVDPGDPGQVYAGTAGDGVWKSTDGGQSWSRAGGELAGQMISALLAAGVPGRVYAVAGGRVFRSDDGGASWQGWSRGLRTSAVSALVLDPGDPSRVYAVTANGVWVLTATD